MQLHKLAFLVFAAIPCSTLSAQAPSGPAAGAQASGRLSADAPKTTVLGKVKIFLTQQAIGAMILGVIVFAGDTNDVPRRNRASDGCCAPSHQ